MLGLMDAAVARGGLHGYRLEDGPPVRDDPRLADLDLLVEGESFLRIPRSR
jgi:hypothetical protein